MSYNSKLAIEIQEVIESLSSCNKKINLYPQLIEAYKETNRNKAKEYLEDLKKCLTMKPLLKEKLSHLDKVKVCVDNLNTNISIEVKNIKKELGQFEKELGSKEYSKIEIKAIGSRIKTLKKLLLDMKEEIQSSKRIVLRQSLTSETSSLVDNTCKTLNLEITLLLTRLNEANTQFKNYTSSRITKLNSDIEELKKKQAIKIERKRRLKK